MVIFTCKYCNKSFKKFPSFKSKYCSWSCFQLDINPTGKKIMQKVCEVCKKTFTTLYATRYVRFCSLKCGYIGRNTLKGNKHPYWKGGKYKDKRGYIRINVKNHPSVKGKHKKYIFEHRFVMEKYLGRYLTPKEVVHHINKIKDDNRIENLKLYNSSSVHVKFENSLRPSPLALGYVSKDPVSGRFVSKV